MKTTVITRMLTLFLALFMLVSVFTACKTENEDASTQSSESAVDTEKGTEALGPETDKNGYILDNIPEDLKLNREVRILHSKHMEKRICVKEEDVGNNVIYRAIYDRWQNVQDRLGIDIHWEAEPGQDGSQNTFIQRVKTQSNTGSAYDAVVCYNLIPGAMAHQGLLQNLTDSEYIELTMPWWPQAYVKEALVNDIL